MCVSCTEGEFKVGKQDAVWSQRSWLENINLDLVWRQSPRGSSLRGEMASTRWFKRAPRCVDVDSLQIKMYPYMWIHIFSVNCQPFLKVGNFT